MDFAVPADDKVKLKESEKKDKLVDGDTNCGWCTWNSPQKIDKVIIITNGICTTQNPSWK